VLTGCGVAHGNVRVKSLAAGNVRAMDSTDPRRDRREDRTSQDRTSEDAHQRSAALAIGLGALVVLVLMIAAASGATRALWP
jgi:hypothetical protein